MEAAAMTLDRIEEMRRGRRSDQVILQEHNNFRSTRPGRMIFAFEGHDDVIFYQVMVEKCGYTGEYDSFVCKGKDFVLALRRQLARNLAEDAIRVTYFVDRDFDGLKGEAASDNLYCTEVYSIENHLLHLDVLKKILRGEFRCAEDATEDNFVRALNFFTEMLDQFFCCMRTANLVIFYLRSKRIYAGDINNDLENFVTVTEQGVVARAAPATVLALVGADGHLTEDGLETLDEVTLRKFAELRPAEDWRGKFNFAFLQKILNLLREDRGRRQPQIFATRKAISARFDGNIMRQLASAALPPESLRAFLAGRQVA